MCRETSYDCQTAKTELEQLGGFAMYGRFFLVVLSLFLLLASTFFQRFLTRERSASAAAHVDEARCPDTFLPVSDETGASRLLPNIPEYCRSHHVK